MKNRLKRLAAVVVLLFGQIAASLMAMPVRVFADPPTITDYVIPFGSSATNTPLSITVGPDGALWFTMRPRSSVFRVTTSGVFTEYPITSGVDPTDIVTGPDGALWFTAHDANKIGRITTSGSFTIYQAPTTNFFGTNVPAQPQGITVGPDGALWFTEISTGKIGRITTAGVITEYSTPSGFDTAPRNITTGPDGALWFTAYGVNKIGRITTSGGVTQFNVPITPSTPKSGPSGITTGPDGALWFTEPTGAAIGRVTTAGSFTTYPISSPAGEAYDIALGPDQALWFTEASTDTSSANNIGRITTSGEITKFPVTTTAFTLPYDITTGPDGALWFTENGANRIGRISVTSPDTVAPVVSGAPDSQPNSAGWYDHDVIVNWSTIDPSPSSGAPTAPLPTVADQEGTHTYASAQSCDPAGNCATGNLTLKIDKSDPDITYSLSQQPNGADWNNTDVTVTFTCSDAISGIASCSGPITVGEGANQTVQGTAVDVAGNSKTVSLTLNVDKTLPSIAYTLSSASPISSAGWYRDDVTVDFQCSDALSGLQSCSQSTTLSSEAANQSVTGTAEDVAGNVNTATASVNIDKTAPVVTSQSFSTNPKSTSQTSVVLTAQVSDSLSGVNLVEYYDPVTQVWQPMMLNGATATAFISTSFLFYPAGTYTFMVRAWDRADNQSLTMSINLHVYNPGGGHVTGVGFIEPGGSTSDPGDSLPAVEGSNVKAKLDFNVRYLTEQATTPSGTNTFTYGQSCNAPQNSCFSVVTDSFDWLIVPNSNDSATFQGLATLTLDEQILGSNYPVRVLVEDGGELVDHYLLRIYPIGSDPDNAQPLYQASGDLTGGSILVHP